MLTYIAGEVAGRFRRSDTQVVHADVARLRLGFLPLFLIFDL